ncbi:hypothetical protein BTW32_29865 [Bacillus thuringiensis]|nr:hypothetical protein BTW32_29865 [Bacillus thuringiensis]
MDKEIVAYAISNLRGTEKEMIKLLNDRILGRRFVNQVSNLKEMRACYKVGFRPYGENLSFQKVVALLKEKGSICMTINI